MSTARVPPDRPTRADETWCLRLDAGRLLPVRRTRVALDWLWLGGTAIGLAAIGLAAIGFWTLGQLAFGSDSAPWFERYRVPIEQGSARLVDRDNPTAGLMLLPGAGTLLAAGSIAACVRRRRFPGFAIVGLLSNATLFLIFWLMVVRIALAPAPPA